MKKFASVYKKGLNEERIEPFAEDNVPNEQNNYEKVVDLTKNLSQVHISNNSTFL